MLSRNYLRRAISMSHKRWISTTENNVTSHMGLNSGESHVTKTAFVINNNTKLTYGDLSKRVGSLVTLLHFTYGVERGDRVLSRVEKSIDNLALYLATLKLGAIYVPLNPSNTMPEIVHYITDSEPHLFVSCNIEQDDIFSNRVEHVVDSTVFFAESRHMKPDYGVENMEPDEIACICYTSGTTGLPKGAMLSHGGLIWNANALVDTWQFTQKDVLLHMLPLYHVHGLFISLNCALFTKSSVIFRPKFDVSDALNWLPQSTVMMGVPTYYSRLIRNSNFDESLAKNIRLFVCGSAPLPLSLWEEFKKRTGHEILERYGMTEATVITSNPYDDRRRGSAGKILPGGDIRTTKEGLVQIRLPSLFMGYWKNAEKTREGFTTDGYFDTGDIGRIDNDGFLWLSGRAKDVIISGGLNVYPKEVEDAIDALPYVLESAVIGVPHHDLGEAVLAICVPEPGFEGALHESEAIDILRSKLVNYKIPKHIFIVDELPRNSLGKVQKNILKERYCTLFYNI